MSSVTHPLTPQDKEVTAAMRAAAAPYKGGLRGIAAREPFDAIIGHTAPAEGVTFRPGEIGGIPGWWCSPPTPKPHAVLLHLHGGWFHWGSAQAYRALVGHIALRAGVEAFIPDYRLAPEHPFPAGLEDVQSCFRALTAAGYERVLVSGDSAGGNLALTLAARFSPAAVAALSPVTDLSLSGPSWSSHAGADFYFTRDQAAELAGSYLAGADAADPQVSPLCGDLSRLPPLLIQVGDQEMLLDDARRYAEKAAAAGSDVRLEIWQGMPHGFQGAVGQLDAADRALDIVGAFLAGRAV